MNFEIISSIGLVLEIRISKAFEIAVLRKIELRKNICIYIVIRQILSWQKLLKGQRSFDLIGAKLTGKTPRTIRNYLKFARKNDWFKDANQLKTADKIFNLSKEFAHTFSQYRVNIRSLNEDFCTQLLIGILNEQKKAIEFKKKIDSYHLNDYLILTDQKVKNILGIRSNKMARKYKEKLLEREFVFRIQIEFSGSKNKKKRPPDTFQFHEKKGLN